MARAALSVLITFFSLLHVLSVCSSENISSEELMEREQKRGGHTFHSFNRKLNNIHRHISEAQNTLHDAMYPPTFPETPVTNPVTTPATIPPANPTPTIVTVSPTNPATTPISIPSTTPITVPPINPVNDPPPLMVPGTTPVTNPVNTYPFSPPVTNPVTTPTTNPVMPPATTTAPTGSGQTWCVAKSGAQEAQLQTALDYACGIVAADCSAIQQTGSCYNPNSLQYHASYAFNSYYQKNPVPTSCDFGGTAMVVNINPSIGSCIYPSSSSAAAATAATTGAGAGAGAGAGTVIGSGSPSVLNTGNPAAATTSIFGTEPPPSGGTTISTSVRVGPMCHCIILTACILTARLISSL